MKYLLLVLLLPWGNADKTELKLECTVDATTFVNAAGIHPPCSETEKIKVVTWNIEWFGFDHRGPDDLEFQLENVVEVLDTLKADVYALQEIFNQEIVDQVVSRMEGNYSGFVSAYIPQAQKLAYLYNTERIDSIRAGPVPDFTDTYWAGRIPFKFTTSVEHCNESSQMTFLNQHGKAFADEESYNRRASASDEMHRFISANMEKSYLFLGDFNDDVTGSTRSGEVSPYRNFVEDEDFRVVTLSISEAGEYSFSNPAGTIRSMIDHITINRPLFPYFTEGSEKVHRPGYIADYLTTTSDHYPVIATFTLSDGGSSAGQTPSGEGEEAVLHQNFPNPFYSSTTIPFELREGTQVELTVYGTNGKTINVIETGRYYGVGFHEIRAEFPNLAGGIYLYRLTFDRHSLVRKMTHIK